MTHPRVLCLGEVLFDCLTSSPDKIDRVGSWTRYPGGAPANVACGLVKLGTPAGFIGCIGSDEAGDSLVQMLQAVGVNCTGVQRHPTAPTRQVYVLHSETGDRSFVGFGDRNGTQFADAFLQADRLPVALFEQAEFLVLGTLELAYPETRLAAFKALKLAERHHLKIVMDVNWRAMFWPAPGEARPLIEVMMQQVDFLKLSDEEAQWLFETIDPVAIAHRLNSVEGVLVTAGERGCAYSFSENAGILAAFSVPVRDTTGGGDSFVAGFIHQICQYGIGSLSEPEMAKRIVTYASAVGAIATMKPGAIASQPTAAEVEAFLTSHPHP